MMQILLGDNGRPGRRASIVVSQVDDFEAAFAPDDMRCLALVSHDEMKATMKDFFIKYKSILKKFRLTGTQSTMKMLGEIFEGDDSVVFGPACNSGPLGGDAELVAMMATGQLGGILFFQDPMTAHAHQVDIECLVRQALVHNTVMATTPTTAMIIMELFKMALIGEGRPEIIPSFFFTLQSPTVQAYKNNQKKAIESHAS
jgi:methylglyoxal synthase